MKSSLWIVVTVVTGVVGFLIGYSVSAQKPFPGIQGSPEAEVHGGARAAGEPQHAPATSGAGTASAGGYGSAADDDEPAQAGTPPSSGGYGPATSGGYGPAAAGSGSAAGGGHGEAKPVKAPARKATPEKPPAGKTASEKPAAPTPAAGGY
jgi:hypothetical protein